MLHTITVASTNVANMSFAEDAKQKAVEINVRTELSEFQLKGKKEYLD